MISSWTLFLCFAVWRHSGKKVARAIMLLQNEVPLSFASRSLQIFITARFINFAHTSKTKKLLRKMPHMRRGLIGIGRRIVYHTFFPSFHFFPKTFCVNRSDSKKIYPGNIRDGEIKKSLIKIERWRKDSIWKFFTRRSPQPTKISGEFFKTFAQMKKYQPCNALKYSCLVSFTQFVLNGLHLIIFI